MRNMIKSGKITISVVLVMLMAFLLPVQVFATTMPEQEQTEKITFDSLNEIEDDANIVSELTDRRDEYTKHFRMDDGTFMAITYNSPVHFKNEKGKWVEYDNSLVAESEATPDEAVAETYTNKKSDIDIDISPNTNTNDLVNIRYKKGNISWKYAGTNKSVAKIKNNNKKHKGNEKFTSIDKLSSQASYKGIYKDVDLDCIVSTSGVKENIILNSADAQNEFEIKYNIKGLNAKQVDDQTIELTNKKDKTVYTISAPYMYDADGNTSTDLAFEILSNKGNKLKVKLIADKGFLKSWGRAYPVTIDPEVSLSGGINTETAYVSKNEPDTANMQQTSLVVGKSTFNGSLCRGLVRCKNIQENYSDKNIVNAKLNLFPMTSSSEMEIEAYPITSSWTNSTATYNNVKFSSEIIDYAKTKKDGTDKVSFDITKYVKKWANGSVANNGIYLKSDDAHTSFGGFACYYPNKRPTFIIKYKDYTGSESNLTSHTVACGQNAEASVGDYTGALVLKQNIYEENGTRNPLNIYATYHSTKAAERSYIGKGWHMSFDKRLTNTGTYYVYLDSDAVEHYFKIETGKTELYDEDDLGYTLKIKSTSIEIDTGSTIESYNIPGTNQTTYIKTETDSENSNNKITYTYDSTNRLTKIVSAQHTYTFVNSSVTSEGETVSICNSISKDGTAFVYFVYYTGLSLISDIAFNDGKHSMFYYSNNYLYKTRQYAYSHSQGGQQLGFTYTNNKVTKITEYGKDGASRRALSIKYNDDNTTEFTDINGNKETYTFDDYGNTITVLNNNGYIENRASNGLSISTGSDSYTKNYLGDSNEPNRIASSSATEVYFSQAEKIDNAQSDKGTVEIDNTVSYLGNKSIKVNNTGESQFFTVAKYQKRIEDLAGEEVTLSSYVKLKDVKKGNKSGDFGAVLRIEAYKQPGPKVLDVYSTAVNKNISGFEWQRISVTAKIPEECKGYYYKVSFGLKNAQGTVWFDCMQFEKSDSVNDYNILADSDFSDSNNYTQNKFWQDQNGNNITTTDGKYQISGLGGEPAPTVSDAQDSESDSSESDEGPTYATYTRTETETVANDIIEETDSYGNITKSAQGFVTRKYKRTYEATESTEETTENDSVNDSENDNTEENEAEDNFKCDNYIYQEVIVNKRNTTFKISGTAKANSVPLNSDYRSFGIALKVKYDGDSDYSETHYQPFNAYTDIMQSVALSVIPYDSEKVIEKVAFAFVYGYNKNTMTIKNAMLNVACNDYEEPSSDDTESSTEPEPETTPEISEDDSLYAIDEELISESVDTSKTHMKSSTQYDSSGNYVTSEVDESGNTVSYNYDGDGQLTKFTDGNGIETKYTYDAIGNMLSLASGDSNNKYTYDGASNLSSIEHNNFNYNYEYDNFDNLTSVKVGSTTLATYTYDNYINLATITYGNGDYIKYTYDNYARITDVKLNNKSIATYTYNKKGQITKFVDGKSGETTEYAYDCNGNTLYKYVISYNGELFKITTGDTEKTTINGSPWTITTGTDGDGNPYVQNDKAKITTTTDDFGRKKGVISKIDSVPIYELKYSYAEGSEDNSTTNLVDKMTYELDGKKIADYQYKYDKNGNITEIKADGEVIAKYTYDNLNQLKTVYDYIGRYYYIYTYDNSGNIIAEHTQRLSSLNYPEGKDFGPVYSYSDSKWNDLLTRFNGHDITYDEIGNPLNYRDGMTMTWQNGRELARIKNDSESYTYAYNLNGLRTSKNVHGTSTNYYYDENNNLISTKRASLIVMFYYDSNGEVYSMSKGDKTYFFIKNLQGDITKIIDDDGNICATYLYDAWGAILEENEDNSIKGINPFRYRGYVYDSETGLYYLQSRYYDPQTGRFINADTYTDTRTCSPLSTNMFAYCENNSIFSVDVEGKRTFFLNGINNDTNSAPQYAKDFKKKLNKVKGVVLIPIYKGKGGFWGTVDGVAKVIKETFNIDVFTNYVVNEIKNSLKKKPLSKGEQLNLIGYSGGGQVALNVMEKMKNKFNNVVLIGAPTNKVWNSTTKVSILYAAWDPLSWTVGWGFKSYFAGWFGHTDYFKKSNIGNVANIVMSIIK